MTNSNKNRKATLDGTSDLAAAWSARLVGQPEAVESVIPYIQMYEASLAPEGRPVGVFLLLGPSGTGKTRTVESLAGVLHGSEKQFVKVDCGEFQMEHEVAKLIGAPPGYLGHRETQPMLTQAKLNAATSEHSSLSIILFDEVEKAAPSLARLLLGVLDKATLRLGDNTTVNFERSLIFLTSNLGAREMIRELQPEFGFEAMTPRQAVWGKSKIEGIGVTALRRKFSPEFVNRIDRVITFQPLSSEALEKILDQHVTGFQNLVHQRLGLRAFQLQLAKSAREFLLAEGASLRYGARELKRTIHRHLIHPIAAMACRGEVPPGATIYAELAEAKRGLRLIVSTERPRPPRRSPRPSLLGSYELDEGELDAA
jgi:ATP-dependent Clp protease ATP-binding subunit ClpA